MPWSRRLKSGAAHGWRYADMMTIKNCHSLILTALVVAFLEHGPMGQGAGQNQIAIVEDSRELVSAEPSRSLGRPFERATPCSVTKNGQTIGVILGPEAKTLIIHHYEKRAWPDIEVVKDFLRRILNGRPEGGSVQEFAYWAEYRGVEISASVEFRSGQVRRAEFANGYAHVEDESGCQWWARYLGPDHSTWIVRRP